MTTETTSVSGAAGQVGLGTVARVLWRRKAVIIASVVVCVVIAVVVDAVQEKTYEATTEIVLVNDLTVGEDAPTIVGATDPDRRVQNALQALGSDAMRDAVARELGRPATVELGVVAGSDVLTITAEADGAERAAATANVYAEVFVRLQREGLGDAIDRATAPMQARIAELESAAALAILDDRPEAAAELTALQRDYERRLEDLVLSGDLVRANGGARVVSVALVPADPIGPDLARYIVIAVLVGLIVGAVLALLVEHAGNRVRGPQDLSLDGDLVALGTVPAVRRRRGGAAAVVATTRSELDGYRDVRTMLEMRVGDDPLQVVQVTSPNSDGATRAVAANLAVVLARGGQQVLLVGVERDAPILHEMFDCRAEPGLREVLRGDVPLVAAIQEAPHHDNLAVLSAGADDHVDDILTAKKLRELLDETHLHVEVVVLCTPPVLSSTDSLVVSRVVDGVVLVVENATTRIPDIGRSVELLSYSGATVLGSVLYGFGPSPRRRDDDESPQEAGDFDGSG